MSEWSHYQQQNSISFQQTKSSSVQKRQTKLKEKTVLKLYRRRIFLFSGSGQVFAAAGSSRLLISFDILHEVKSEAQQTSNTCFVL